MSAPLGAVDHVAIAVRPESREAARRFMTEVLGAEPGFGLEQPDFAFEQFHLNGFKFEVLWPTSEESFLTRFLDKRGEGLHHITLIVDNLDRACSYLESEDVAVVDKNTANPHWMEAFISPRSAFGVLYQLAQKGPPRPK